MNLINIMVSAYPHDHSEQTIYLQYMIALKRWFVFLVITTNYLQICDDPNL